MSKPSTVRKATLVDVAKAAGVGPMTVSRTINGHPYVSESTAKKVRAAIRKLGYRPNQAARILTGQSSKSIGLIVPDVADPFFSVVSRAVQQAARKVGYTVWLAVSDGDIATEKAEIEQMKNHPVDGIVLAPVSSRARHLTATALGSIPIVTIDRPLEGPSTDSVEVENRKGSHMAVEHLRSHRYQRIACIATDFHLRSIRLRVSAYEECLRQEKLPVTKVILEPGEEVLPALKALFKLRQKPDALFITNNVCTTRVIQALQVLGIRVPEDVALVGFDDVDFYSLLSPSITAVRQPVAEIGAAAAELLLNRIRNEGPSAPVAVTLPVELVVRESCGCPPSSQG
ncbi:transcriptional regulator, LacI family [Bryocella elongata]|uniref:Transcriptional regulator, LacI family n=1 Tax=Bryocella elongata TaxID=863522 RepID=A0A1H5UF41_9BACT|nr:LacI family DNA-binding transcriptional regulator [Bryocella elongata]SEF73078.1 transcriptional regulator, LacI family [Bryocella elongata]